ncbi:hypothetical protein MTR_2g077630 [Medicago truncatula]|uniref:Uncharacterized protein n=1 Tax=Medicago truncatula TaxID=3880 RepID=G7IJI1_MEDTR|nr:hypothetical protein MTR_2g077630 [Medicago truncatula]
MTRTNREMVKKIFSTEDISCSAGCGQVESEQLLFIHCDIYGSIWQKVRIGVSGVDHQNLQAHFFQFTNYLEGLRTRRSFLQLLWLLCVCLVWKERASRQREHNTVGGKCAMTVKVATLGMGGIGKQDQMINIP